MTIFSNWETTWRAPSLLSNALLPASWAYSIALALKPEPKPTGVEGLQVVSVGNLIVGGAGKTPVVIYLADWALRAGQRVAILSRGYGRASTAAVHWSSETPRLPDVTQVGDEPRLIARRLPAVELFIDADRLTAARAAKAAGCTVAILDDGYQHQQLARDVNLLIDAGIGNGRLLPAGPLREPLSAAARADVLWARDGARDLAASPAATRVSATHEVTTALAPDGTEQPIWKLKNRRVIAFAALARPSRFLKDLADAGANVLESHLFSDHAAFTPADIRRLEQAAERNDALLVTTEKDRERLPETMALWLPRVTVRLDEGREELAQRLGWPLV